MSYPNQKILVIDKPEMPPPFLQIPEACWREASQLLTPKAFIVYLYLAQNQNGYKFEYSPSAIAEAGLMTKGTATKARQELEEKGYIEDGVFHIQSKNYRNSLVASQKEIDTMMAAARRNEYRERRH